MAKLTVILVDEGVKLRDYSVAGDLEVLSKAFKEAVIKSFDSCIKSIQPTMSIPKENDAEHEVLATQESSEVKADSSYILQPGRGSLVGLKCPTCGKVHISFLEVGQETTCHHCNTVFKVPNNLIRSEEHTSELQSRQYLVCRLL